MTTRHVQDAEQQRSMRLELATAPSSKRALRRHVENENWQPLPPIPASRRLGPCPEPQAAPRMPLPRAERADRADLIARHCAIKRVASATSRAIAASIKRGNASKQPPSSQRCGQKYERGGQKLPSLHLGLDSTTSSSNDDDDDDDKHDSDKENRRPAPAKRQARKRERSPVPLIDISSSDENAETGYEIDENWSLTPPHKRARVDHQLVPCELLPTPPPSLEAPSSSASLLTWSSTPSRDVNDDWSLSPAADTSAASSAKTFYKFHEDLATHVSPFKSVLERLLAASARQQTDNPTSKQCIVSPAEDQPRQTTPQAAAAAAAAAGTQHAAMFDSPASPEPLVIDLPASPEPPSEQAATIPASDHALLIDQLLRDLDDADNYVLNFQQ